MSSSERLIVCLDAQLASGTSGGIEQVVIGLAHGLSQLDDGPEEFIFLTLQDADEWIQPYVHGSSRVVAVGRAPVTSRWKRRLQLTTPLVHRFLTKAQSALPYQPPALAQSNGTIEGLGANVMHFTWQSGFMTSVPSIFQPHDLQHLHLPQFFGKRAALTRESVYRSLCHQARLVSVMSSWGKDDIIHHYGLAPDKVIVVPNAPALDAYQIPSEADLVEAQSKLSLPARFLLYPAQTWPHKNHLALLEALVVIRSRYQMEIPLICSGRLNEFFPRIEKRIEQLRLSHQVKFLGHVTPLKLQCLYHQASGIVFPSKFEGFGMPIVEAFQADRPVACSNVTCLPGLVRDAALLFDPDEPEQIAEALYRLWTDENLRRQLIERGRKRAADFSWERTALTFRAYYRQIAGRFLSEQDRAAITAPPVL